MYIIRLDDASEHMDLKKWMQIKKLLDKYGIKPIFGIIPNNQDLGLLRYEKVAGFWECMRSWQSDGWVPAMHGYTHVFETQSGGINPVNHKSEFAGISIKRQREKIRAGYEKLKSEGIEPSVFFAPAHTFDVNTLKAIYIETPIRVISDTIASDVYYKKPFYFIPQQSGRVRRLPFQTVTFCYHPNRMNGKDFIRLERFLHNNQRKFSRSPDRYQKRQRDAYDMLLEKAYFGFRSIRGLIAYRG